MKHWLKTWQWQADVRTYWRLCGCTIQHAGYRDRYVSPSSLYRWSWSEVSSAEMPCATAEWSHPPCIHHARFVAANSHDFNPADYKIWGIIQRWVYQTKVQNVNDLKQCLTEVGWNGTTIYVQCYCPVARTSPCLYSSWRTFHSSPWHNSVKTSLTVTNEVVSEFHCFLTFTFYKVV